ncbi:Beta-mannosidase [Fulvivirga imtechensis AK7]|uniref:Beta-mannosidase B n=1 Tax=Fulvivirga imtechensis AK7 TaxID=1237149 RepID=L8JTL7_9BACT|nr:glycoside hydrolase family 2 protein [Fulvivirga imtechensis]ELR72155.1 Beta-mannosidase [Fulvivirga imtechensis AK7]
MTLKVTNHKNLGATSRRILELNEGWRFRQAGKEQWHEVSVPSTNFTALLAHGLIDDPFYRDNEAKLQWIEKEDWEYRLLFELNSEDLDYPEIDIVFKGLDTYADVNVNGHLLFKANNMFVEWRENCKQWLKPGMNEIHVHFHSPIKATMPLYQQAGFTYPAGNDKTEEKLSVYSRKAPYHFGWDWGPKFVTSGIWRPVFLEFSDPLRISDFYIEQHELTDKRAVLTANLEIISGEGQEVELLLTTDSPSDDSQYIATQLIRLEKGVNSVSSEITIDHPIKWWPAGMGAPDLYHLKAQLLKDGALLDKRELKIGLRTIEVVNRPDKHGESFFIKVNEQPFFIKGANYIPSDSFPDRVTRDKHQEVFKNAVGSNMNMLRVWGGGIYEDDDFYDLADEFGILIWQDFMFACSMYPGDEAFLNNVKKEAIYNVKRLRNHPSLALWCGNNEIAVGWKTWGWQKEYNYSEETCSLLKKYYDDLFHQLLPSVIKELDGNRFYLPSSPISDWKGPDDMKMGNNHFWGVWHGELPFSAYETYVPRFMSEYGFQSFPELTSVKQYTIPEDWDLNSDVMLLHQKHPRGNALIKKYMELWYNAPKDFGAFLYLSQILQAEGIKIAIEAHRRNKPFCMGTIYWQLNDCWPVASWSSVDYYGRWKALQYFVKKAYADIITSTVRHGDTLEVYVVSDRYDASDVVLEVITVDFFGNIACESKADIKIEPNSSTVAFQAPVNSIINGNNEQSCLIISRVKEGEQTISENLYYLVMPKDLHLRKPTIEGVIKEVEGKYFVDLSTDYLARNVVLKAKGTNAHFSDNFFDLIPGQPRTVEVKVEHPEKLNESLTIYSLFDACIE